MNFLIETLLLGLTNLRLHKMRSFLTALGIICGVAAVIVMVAIGEGNKRKALKDIEDLGATNIIVRSRKPPEPATTGQATQRVIAYGITRLDMRRIAQTVRGLKRIVPLKHVGARAVRGQYQVAADIFGTTPDLLDVASLHVARGRYLTDSDLDRTDNVAVIGAEVAERLFPLTDPLGGELRVDDQVFKVIGILRPIGLAGGSGSALVGRNLNFDIHIPLTAAESRFGDVLMKRSSGSFEREQMEIKELYIDAGDPDNVLPVADQVRLIIDAAHKEAGDTEFTVPLELLYQRQRALFMFNALMTTIAAISLLVGGIGIMNIMLASVTERTREIGIRRALGATRRHIWAQFLVETTILSTTGGVIGIGLGLGMAALIGVFHESLEGIEMPQVTEWSIVVSFIVATAVGIVFGLYPAVKAAQQDPIVALRHD